MNLRFSIRLWRVIRMSQILSTVEPLVEDGVFDGLRQLQGGLISNNKINYISYKEKNTTTASGNDPIKRETYSKTGNWSYKYKYCLLGEWVIYVPVQLVPIASQFWRAMSPATKAQIAQLHCLIGATSISWTMLCSYYTGFEGFCSYIFKENGDFGAISIAREQSRAAADYITGQSHIG